MTQESGTRESAQMNDYLAHITAKLWDYRGREFSGRGYLFDSSNPYSGRPPVFAADPADQNVIVSPEASSAQRAELLRLDPLAECHQVFRRAVIRRRCMWNRLW